MGWNHQLVVCASVDMLMLQESNPENWCVKVQTGSLLDSKTFSPFFWSLFSCYICSQFCCDHLTHQCQVQTCPNPQVVAVYKFPLLVGSWRLSWDESTVVGALFGSQLVHGSQTRCLRAKMSRAAGLVVAERCYMFFMFNPQILGKMILFYLTQWGRGIEILRLKGKRWWLVTESLCGNEQHWYLQI